MVKLPKSSRPDRRKPSETVNHPLQRSVFSPPLASSLSDVGTVARIFATAFIPLVLAYLNIANNLPDEVPIKSTYYTYAYVLTAVGFLFAAVEFARTQRMLDTEEWGRATRRGLIALNFVSTISLFGGVTNLVWMQSTAFQTRVVEKEKALALEKAAKQRANEDKERLRKEAEAECNAQKAKDVDALVRRRQAAYADHKKCLADWVKPYLMSTETAEQACLPKHKEFQQLVQSVKAREAKECPSAR